MMLTYKEKSIWITMVATVLVFGFYFTTALNVFRSPDIPEASLIGVFISVMVLTIIIQLVSQRALAVANRKDALANDDERATLVDLKATRVAYFVLAIGIWMAGFNVPFIPSALAMANVMLFFFIISGLAGSAAQLVYLRRGV